MLILKVNIIRHKFSKFELDVRNVLFEDNHIIGLIGENGSGKTTLMNLLSEFLDANIAYEVEGINVDEILFIPSELEPFEYMTVEEFVDIIREYSNSHKSNQELIEALSLVGKEEVLIGELSQGMRKKLSLINVFTRDYKLIILDEPFNSIDIKYIYQLKQLLVKLKRTSTIVISSHILDTLSDLCDDFIYLEDGRVKKVFKNTGDIKVLERELFE
ncbi:MAG: ATP-binding cassette domain-containing protein [Streptococcus orisratti]|uniref:ATP-binding cassette domain-containing protein n=1 Tax=Streptococcus orisratti TaxID=114652 RepID=UPI002A91AB7F|nr:ATP-binding cassette domain-containing protein [Streptococcus orisratti]MDY5636754.1 ATP-binding cassette domain-containing protein [Streptococcus orisratti]